MTDELKRLIKHSAIFGISNVLSRAIGFIMIPIYTHYIPPTDYGLLELLDLTMNIIAMFIGMWIANAAPRFYFAFDDEVKKKTVISSSLFFAIILCFLVCAIGYFMADQISKLLFKTDVYKYFIQLSLITLALNSILQIPLTYIRALERSIFFSIISILRLFISLCLNIYFVVFKELGILGILYSGLVTSTIISVALLVWLIRDVGLRFNVSILIDMVKFGAPLIFSSLGMFVMHFGDRFILKDYAGMAGVGVYSLGYKFGFLIAFVIQQPFSMIWGVRCFTVIRQPEGEATFGRVFLVYSWLLIYSCLVLSIMSYEIVAIVADPRYIDAFKIIPIISMAYVFRAFADFYKLILYIEDKTMLIGKLTIATTAYCVINYLLFIPWWGAMGAAVATLSSFIFMTILYLLTANRIRYIDYQLRRMSYFFLIAIVFFCIGYNLNALLSIGSTLILKALILVLYPLICYILVLRRGEKIMFKEGIQRLISKKHIKILKE